MKRTNNKGVIEAFIWNHKPVQSHNGNLYMTEDGMRLMNYGTCLAQFIDGKLIINSTRYSVTTSKIQTWLRAEAPSFIEVENVPMWERYLDKFVPEEVK